MALFQPGSQGMNAIEAELPLEPALASLSDGIRESFSAIGTNMEDLEQQLEQWKQQKEQQQKQQQQRVRPGGSIFSSARPAASPASGLKAPSAFRPGGSSSPWLGAKVVQGAAGKSPAPSPSLVPAGSGSQQAELLFKVLQAQQDTEANLRARIRGLRQEMEKLGIIKTDAEHQAGKTLGRWGDALDSGDLDDDYGSEGSSDSGYEREQGSAAPRSTGRFSAPSAGRSPLVGFGTPIRGRAAASPLAPAAAGTPGGSVWSGASAFATPTVSSRGWQGGGQSLHWVSPSATAAKSSSRLTPSGSAGRPASGSKRQVTPGTTSAGSSEAWSKLATELSNSTGQKASGGGRSRVRTTYATPSSSRSSGRRAAGAPDRPSSPLQIPAAAAGVTAAPSGGAAAGPSEPFSFNRTGQAAGAAGAAAGAAATTPAKAPPRKLSFSPVAATPAAATSAGGAGGAASPAMSPLWGTPAGRAAAPEADSILMMQANPLYDRSPGPGAASPLAPVPAPALNFGSRAATQSGAAAAGAAAPKRGLEAAAAGSGAGKPPTQPKSSQPPEPPAALLHMAQRQVRVWGCKGRKDAGLCQAAVKCTASGSCRTQERSTIVAKEVCRICMQSHFLAR